MATGPKKRRLVRVLGKITEDLWLPRVKAGNGEISKNDAPLTSIERCEGCGRWMNALPPIVRKDR
jgi:hypothetical protein